MSRKPALNWLDQAIGVFSPQAALERAVARSRLDMIKRGGFEAARNDWRGSSWRAEANGPNTSLVGDLQGMRRRARSLVRNAPLAKRSIEVLTAHTIGCGFRPSWQTDSKAQRARLSDAWLRFVDTADARRQVDLYGLQEQAVRGMFEGGETLAMRQRNRYGLQYLLIEGEQLDHQRDGIFEEGLITRLGVAIEKEGHGVAGYYLFAQNPDDALLWGYFPYSKFSPATGIHHLYRIRRPGQVRGVPELAAATMLFRDRADMMEAAIVKARTEACFVGFITSDDAGAANLATRTDTRTGADGTVHDVNFGEMSPGMIGRLRPGEDVKFGQPSSQSDFAGFMLHTAMEAASGVGVTYDQATGDLRQANYSSLRAGKIEFRRLVEMIQHLTVIPMLCRPMYQEFLAFQREFGKITERDAAVPVKWITPAWEPIDPIKDLQADILAVRAGRLSWQDFVASWGEDPHEQLAEIAATNKMLDELGITLDTDPRKVSAGGQMHSVADPAADQPAQPAKD